VAIFQRLPELVKRLNRLEARMDENRGDAAPKDGSGD
jgi:hypothetical protein